MLSSLKKRTLCIILGMLTCCVACLAQDDSEFEGARTFYRSDISGGGMVHTNGWGLTFKKGKRIDGSRKWVYGGQIIGMKHAKEFKSIPYNDEAKQFVYGKENSLTILQPTIGREVTKFKKDTKKGVAIGYAWAIGPSIGILKPIYLEIARPTVINFDSTPRTERYDASVHRKDQIYGRAPAFKGLEESKIYPGLHAQVGLDFEYSPYDDMIKQMEVGIAFDGYGKRVPMMAFINNNQYFVTLYASVLFGKKSFN